MKLSRKPRRMGTRYCSSACGRGCTIFEHKRAVLQAKKMAANLGRNWRPRVWENLGWHSEAFCGKMAVYHHGGGEYWATINLAQQFTATAKSPTEAIRKALSNCDDFMASMQKERKALDLGAKP